MSHQPFNPKYSSKRYTTDMDPDNDYTEPLPNKKKHSHSDLPPPPPYQDPPHPHPQNSENKNNKEKPISCCSVLLLFGCLIWGIVALILDHDARNDGECGNIYEYCIVALVIHSLTIIIEVLRLFHRYDPCLAGCEPLGHLALAIWSFVIWGQQFSNDCHNHYKSEFATLYYFYLVHFYIYAIGVGILCAILLAFLISALYSAFMECCCNLVHK